jgi:hypothetical protein
MRKPDTIIIDGRAYSWRALCELREQQLTAWRSSRPAQPALFDLKTDCRPPAERTAAGRFDQPTLLAWLSGP